MGGRGAVVALRQSRRDSGGTHVVGGTTWENSLRRCTRRYSSQRDEFHHTRGTKEKRREANMVQVVWWRLSRCDNPAATAAERRGWERRLTTSPCAAARGATRRSATSSTTREGTKEK